jgi:hypothetical protein
MKKHLLRLRQILLIALLLIIGSCQTEEIVTSSDTYTTATSKYINLSELRQNKNAYKKLVEVRNKAVQKGIYDSLYKFTIDTTDVLVVEDSTYRSYSFVVYPDKPDGQVNNLFLNPQPDGSYLPFLIKYKLSDEEIESTKKGGELLNMNTKTTFYPLYDFDTGTVLKCTTSFIMLCDYYVTVKAVPKHQGELTGCNDPDCLYDYVYTYVPFNCTVMSTFCSG